MRKFFFLIFFISSLLAGRASAQSITGQVLDGFDRSSLPGTVVVLYHLPDSASRVNMTDTGGRFVFTGMGEGDYVVKVLYVGYNEVYKNVHYTGSTVDLGSIVLQTRDKKLNELVVKEQMATGKQKGDTTEYNAGAFKTNPDANAGDLVEKLPGVQNQNGKVQAQGEDVKRVLVDGKPYFGDDPATVLKNLPADMIDKVQVFDQQSDQSQFTGFNDGNTTKTINIITKPAFRNGQFGRVYAGYGYGDDYRYKAGGNINFFKNDRKITIVAQSNNINEQNFSTEDLLGVAGTSGGNRGGGGPGGPGGGRRGGGNSNDVNDFLVGQQGGINKTNAAGLNYADKWGKKITASGSYFLNRTDNNSASSVFRQYVLASDSGQVYEQDNRASSANTNHRFNFRFEYAIDSNNSLLVRPRLSLQENSGSNILLGETRSSTTALNQTHSDYSSNLTGYNFANSILFRHKFALKGRTISIGFDQGATGNDGGSFLLSDNTFFSGGSQTSDSINQSASLDKKGWSLSSNIAYTEPLGKKSQLQFEYNIGYNKTNSDKQTYNFSQGDGAYSLRDTLLSSTFNNTYTTQSAGLSLRNAGAKYQVMVGAKYQFAYLRNDQTFPYAAKVSKPFYNLLPSGMYQYNFTQQKNLRIFYRSSTNVPSVEQLQSVVNNSNPILLSTGNPNLNQSVQHGMFTRYSALSPSNSRSFFAMLGASYTFDYIANSTLIATKDTMIDNGFVLEQGSQLSRPVNIDGQVSIRSYLNYGMPVKKIKSNLGLSLSMTYSRTPGMINNRTNYANSPTAGLGVSLTSNVSTKLDFTISSNTSFSYVSNTLQTQLNSQYTNQTTRFKLNWLFGKGFVFQTDLSHQLYTGLSQGYNQNFLLWNAAFGYKFMKNDAAELRLSVYDLLKQNNSISRNVTETYYEDVNTIVLQRYFMLTFSYNIKNFVDDKKPEKEPKKP